MTWTTTNLLQEVKLVCMLPDINGSLSNEDILILADHAMQDDITPLVISMSKAYWVYQHDTDLVQSQTGYNIPSRAIGQKLADLLWTDNNGNQYNIPEISPQDACRYKVGFPNVPGQGFVYHFVGDRVSLLPPPASTSGTLNMKYYLRRSNLINEIDGGFAQVSSIASNVITTNIDPSTVFNSSSFVDIVKFRAPNDPIVISAPVTNVTGTTMTIDADYLPESPEDIETDDYIFIEEETIVPGMPADFRTLLVHATAARVLTALADPKVDQTYALVDRDKQRLHDLLAPRNEGETPRIVNYSSILRGSSRKNLWPR